MGCGEFNYIQIYVKLSIYKINEMKKRKNTPQINQYEISFKLNADEKQIHKRFYTETSKEIALNNLSYNIKKEYDCEPLIEEILKYNRFTRQWQKA